MKVLCPLFGNCMIKGGVETLNIYCNMENGALNIERKNRRLLSII